MRSWLIFEAIWGQSRAENCQLGRGSSRQKGCRAVGSEINKILNDLPFVSAVVCVWSAGPRPTFTFFMRLQPETFQQESGDTAHRTSHELFNVPVKSSFVELRTYQLHENHERI